MNVFEILIVAIIAATLLGAAIPAYFISRKNNIIKEVDSAMVNKIESLLEDKKYAKIIEKEYGDINAYVEARKSNDEDYLNKMANRDNRRTYTLNDDIDDDRIDILEKKIDAIMEALK